MPAVESLAGTAAGAGINNNILADNGTIVRIRDGQSYTLSDYDTIDLSIPNNIHSTNIKLYDLLDSYTNVEILDTDNQWKCDECNTRVNCMKKIHFWK